LKINLYFLTKQNVFSMKNMLLSSAGTLVIGFLCNKFLPPGMATFAVPAVSALAGILMKQDPQQAATSGLVGGGALGAITSLMGDNGMGTLLSSVLGSGALSSILGGGVLGGAGGGIGGLLQGMLNKEKA
jgi:hypothetical protein